MRYVPLDCCSSFPCQSGLLPFVGTYFFRSVFPRPVIVSVDWVLFELSEKKTTYLLVISLNMFKIVLCIKFTCSGCVFRDVLKFWKFEDAKKQMARKFVTLVPGVFFLSLNSIQSSNSIETDKKEDLWAQGENKELEMSRLEILKLWIPYIRFEK